ncbi:hypothetical protein WKI68_31200 [Streptomyces sp. MS1.HAVA.3]|uniref:Uncharacterized protein n=1 Tax=Streptomyces caledonius TaxID=3134107 RepID=A0ABU8U9J1_9ACTN
MNIRSLTRGDGVVIGAAALLFIASFLDFYSATGVDMPSAWNLAGSLVLPSVFLVGFIAAGLLITGRFQPETRKVLGLPLAAWGSVLAVSAAWSALWSLIKCPELFDIGAGAILTFLATLALAGVALFSAKVPALAGQLVPDPKPAAVPPYAGQPQPGAGYGYPGGQQPYGSTRSRSRRTAAPDADPRPGPGSAGRPPGSRARPGGGLHPVLVRGPGGPPPLRRGRLPHPDRRTRPGHLVPGGRAAWRGHPGRPDPGRPPRRPERHLGHPARLTGPPEPASPAIEARGFGGGAPGAAAHTGS